MFSLYGLQESCLGIGRLEDGLDETDMTFADILVRGAEILVTALGLGRCLQEKVGDAAEGGYYHYDAFLARRNYLFDIEDGLGRADGSATEFKDVHILLTRLLGVKI